MCGRGVAPLDLASAWPLRRPQSGTLEKSLPSGKLILTPTVRLKLVCRMENYQQRLDLAFAALADPTRRAIVARLCSGDATVGELAEPFRNRTADTAEAHSRA